MTTVVSAYYQFRSKFPSTQYLIWIRNFLENVNCSLIFYTTADLIPLFSEMRSKNSMAQSTRFVDLPMTEWSAFSKYGRDFWENQQLIDPEARIHSPELYAIWYEKKEFVKRAIQYNPFSSTKFIWCDAGCFRYPNWFPKVASFGQDINIPDFKIVLLQIYPFTSEERESHTPRNFERVDRIGGGIQAGSIVAWQKWSDCYDQQLDLYVEAGKFVGKDQSLMAEIVLNHPELVQLISPIPGIQDPWFTLLITFS